MGGSESRMSYKLDNDDATQLYDYSNLNLPTGQDLRPFATCINVASNVYPSSPSISFVNAYNCLCNATDTPSPIPSSLALYQITTNDITNTLEIFNTFKLKTNDLPTETEWPYIESHIFDDPPKGKSQFASVALRRVHKNERGICEPLANKNPVMCAMKITDNYVLSNPEPDEDHDTFGYAAVCIVGYNSHDKRFVMKDPYNNRFINVPFDYFFADDNVTDLYTLILSEADDEEEDSPKFI